MLFLRWRGQPLDLPNAHIQPPADPLAVLRARVKAEAGLAELEAPLGPADMDGEPAEAVLAVQIGHDLAVHSARLHTWVTSPSA